MFTVSITVQNGNDDSATYNYLRNGSALSAAACVSQILNDRERHDDDTDLPMPKLLAITVTTL